MKICVTAQGDSLNALVDPRFGRCQYFIIVDSQTLDFEAIRNENMTAGSGAGIQSAQLMADREVEIVLTGNVGPNAFNTLNAAGIKVIVGISGTVNEAIQKYNKGDLNSVQGPSVGPKSGL